MENDAQSSDPLADLGFFLAPIHSFDDNSPLRLCVLTRLQPDAATGWFVLVRELPNARIYLGAVCDAAGRVQEWVEIWTQTSELRDLVFSSYEERLTNHTFDQRWHSEFESQRGHPKCTFTFKPEGPKLSGKAKAEVRDQKREVDLKEGKVDGETVSFGELLSIKSFDRRMP